MPHDALGTPSLAARGETAPSEFDRFFENTPSPMIVADFDGSMKRVNRACERLAGFTADELRAAPFANFIHPDDRETAELAILEMAATGVGREVDVRVLCKDGSFKWTEWTGTPFTERQIFYLIGKDVTDRHIAEEELNRFFEPSLNPMFVGGFDGMVKRFNPALAQLTGYSREEILSRPIASFSHPEDLPA